jgi:putative MATE family efflux protein
MLSAAFRLAGPVLAEESYSMLMGAIVTAVVGKIGPTELAAFTLAVLIQSSTVLIAGVVGVGSATLSARQVGTGNWNGLRATASHTIVYGFMAGVILALGGYFAADYMYLFIDADPEVVHLTGQILRLFAVFAPFLLITWLVKCLLRGMGETRLAFIIYSINNTVDLIVTFSLVFAVKPGFGVYGATWGAGAAEVVSGILSLAVLFNFPKLKLRIRDIFALNPLVIKQIGRISLPVAWEQVALQVGFTLYSFELVSVGSKQFAGNQIALQLESIPLIIGCGLSVATMSLVGQCLGKNLKSAAERLSKALNYIAIVLMTMTGLALYLFSSWLIPLFSLDSEVIRWSKICTLLSIAEQPTMAIGLVLGNALRGAGDTKWPAYSTIAGMWLVRIPLTYLLIDRLDFSIAMAWIITAADHLVRSVILIIRFYGGEWKKLKTI